MRQMHDKLVSDIELLKGRQEAIKAKVAVAKTQDKVNDISTAGAKAEGAMNAFNRMESKADAMLDKSNAMAELNAQPKDTADDLAKKYEEAGSTEAVDDALAKMKAEMGLS